MNSDYLDISSKDIILFGRIVKRYKMSVEDIDDLNEKYETVKKQLGSYNTRLAGRLKSELNFTKILEKTSSWKKIMEHILDYQNTCVTYHILKDTHNMDIQSCWINDMKSGEYNPPHTHHDGTGWSSVLFLKIPEFVDDTKEDAHHKFKDGQLGFIGVDGSTSFYITPKVGDFYIFEARHQHFVMPFKTKIKGKIRRSMSFNFIINNKEQNV